MTTSYNGHNDIPHFEGLWAPVEEKDERQRALLFLGDCYLVFFEYFPSTRVLNFSSQTYVLEEDRIVMSSLMQQGESDDEVEVEGGLQILYWGITEDMLIEIEQDGESSVWEPVLVETLAEEGFPVVAIEGYRKLYSENGIPHSIVGVAPIRPGMEALKKGEKNK
jgi:hypothetical protein